MGAHAAVFRLIAGCGGTGPGNVREWAALLRERAPNDHARAFVTRLAVESLRVPRATASRTRATWTRCWPGWGNWP